VPRSIHPAQLAKLVKISEAFERVGNDDMLRLLDTKAHEVSGHSFLLYLAAMAHELPLLFSTC
jgi:hypothetical protein